MQHVKMSNQYARISNEDLIWHGSALGAGASGEVFKVTWKSRDNKDQNEVKLIEAAAKRIQVTNIDEVRQEIEYLEKLNHETSYDCSGQ